MDMGIGMAALSPAHIKQFNPQCQLEKGSTIAHRPSPPQLFAHLVAASLLANMLTPFPPHTYTPEGSIMVGP